MGPRCVSARTPRGTVDLRTGTLRELRREDHTPTITSVAPLAIVDPELDMPVFWKFLHEVTSCDPDVIRYLQQYGGYCLTGDTREQMLLFVHGPGGNGKSLLQNTVAQILGEYAWTAPPEMFISSRSERHPTELASLRGISLAVASENESRKAWAEVRIKQMTGGDRISARLMRQDFFEFDVKAKFFFVGNNQPALTQVDEAMRRRFHVLEFAFLPRTPDVTLAAKLKPEFPQSCGGSLMAACSGSPRPVPSEAIRSATAEYFDDQDMVQAGLSASLKSGSAIRSFKFRGARRASSAFLVALHRLFRILCRRSSGVFVRLKILTEYGGVDIWVFGCGDDTKTLNSGGTLGTLYASKEL